MRSTALSRGELKSFSFIRRKRPRPDRRTIRAGGSRQRGTDNRSDGGRMGMAGRGDEGDVAVVAEGAVIARINRLLAKDGNAIKVARELTRLHASMGWFHEIDTHRKLVT